MAYNKTVVFVETTYFTKALHQYLSDDEYRELQLCLMLSPDAGDLIRGSGGIRKLRWSRSGMGKSGGVRIIYYWAKPKDQIYMLTMYSKSEQENIDSATLAKIAKRLEEMK